MSKESEYMVRYRRQPPARLKVEACKLGSLRTRLIDLIDPLYATGEEGAAELLQVAVAEVGCAIIAVNTAVAALPSRTR